jgi:hypothetical protein
MACKRMRHLDAAVAQHDDVVSFERRENVRR